MSEGTQDVVARLNERIIRADKHRHDAVEIATDETRDVVAELSHLRTDNTRLREALEKIGADDVYGLPVRAEARVKWMKEVARAALSPAETEWRDGRSAERIS